MLSLREERLAIEDAISRFPKYFRLPDCKGVCRISETASFFSGPTLYLYTEFEDNNHVWRSWAKGTEAELKAAMRRCPQL